VQKLEKLIEIFKVTITNVLPPFYGSRCRTYYLYIHRVSKNIPDIFSRNSRKHCRIFIIFGICENEENKSRDINIRFPFQRRQNTYSN